MPEPTIEQPRVTRGTWEKNGKYPEWKEQLDGSLIAVEYGTFERKNGDSGVKRVTFGIDKAKAIVNAAPEINRVISEME